MTNDKGYFSGVDVEITLLNHPDEQWHGHTVDCPYFSLTLGSSPIHIWNYARRDGPAMVSPDQRGRLQQLQSVEAAGAAFDDTARSNAYYQLQLVLNQDRFKSTYYKFRSMTEIGDVLIRYTRRVEFGEDGGREAGYKLIGGRVGSVSEEVNVRSSPHPAVQITFENGYALGETQNYSTVPGVVPDAEGVDPERLAQGLGRTPEQPEFTLQRYRGRASGRVVDPNLFEAVGIAMPKYLGDYDALEPAGQRVKTGDPQRWVPAQPFMGPILVAGVEEYVYIWTNRSANPNEVDWGYRPLLLQSETEEYKDNGMQKLQQYLTQLDS